MVEEIAEQQSIKLETVHPSRFRMGSLDNETGLRKERPQSQLNAHSLR